MTSYQLPVRAAALMVALWAMAANLHLRPRPDGHGADQFAFEYAGTATGFDTLADCVHGVDSLSFNGIDYGVGSDAAVEIAIFTGVTTIDANDFKFRQTERAWSYR